MSAGLNLTFIQDTCKELCPAKTEIQFWQPLFFRFFLFPLQVSFFKNVP